MRYTLLPSDEFAAHRAAFVAQMTPGSMAVFCSNAMPSRTADTYHPYRQHSDLYYLSGIDQEETILVLYPDAPEEQYREMLFVRETSEEIAIREGYKLTHEQARDRSGINNVMWTSQFDRVFHYLTNFCTTIYCNLSENVRATPIDDLNKQMADKLAQTYPLHTFARSGPIMKALRMIKSPAEVETIQHACQITGKAFDRVLAVMKPGVMEYEIEAEMTYEFLRNGASGHAYTPIVASGYNACVLHYIDNDMACQDGDLVLMDFGCEYGNYASDCTRTIPVNGKFTPRQAAVYDAVLRVHKAACELLTVGKTVITYHQEIGEIMTKELIDLGLLTAQEVADQSPDAPVYKKYFMHGTSHHLGLDTHDHSDFYTPIAPGMVFTVEPGIYIRDESLGVRLETNIVITEHGYTNLMAHIPIEREEIEARMAAET